MISSASLVFLTLGFAIVSNVDAHGYVSCPLPRQYRDDKPFDWTHWIGITGPNSFDGGKGNAQNLNSGIPGGSGYIEEQSRGHGICGDYMPRNAFTASSGIYGPTDPRGTYIAGGVLDITVNLTVWHGGHFEFRLCDIPDGEDLSSHETQDCFNKHILKINRHTPEYSGGQLHGSTRFDYMSLETGARCPNNHNQHWPEGSCCHAGGNCSSPDQNDDRWVVPEAGGEFMIHLDIPQDVNCDHCVLQWYYQTGNSIDHYPEAFWNCVDVRILPQGTQNVATGCSIPGSSPTPPLSPTSPSSPIVHPSPPPSTTCSKPDNWACAWPSTQDNPCCSQWGYLGATSGYCDHIDSRQLGDCSCRVYLGVWVCGPIEVPSGPAPVCTGKPQIDRVLHAANTKVVSLLSQSTVYSWEGFCTAAKTLINLNAGQLTGKPLGLYLGDESNTNLDLKKGIVNIAGLLAQCMWESGGDSPWTACDENNYQGWTTSACTQRTDGIQYADLTSNISCAVDKNMHMVAETYASWTPGPLECSPGTATEGCCWWGRGAIQTTGPHNVASLQKDVVVKMPGFEATDLCTNPEAICQHDELKWVGAIYYWTTIVQEDPCFDSTLTAFATNMSDSTSIPDCLSFARGSGGIVNNGYWNAAAHGEAGRLKYFNNLINTLRSTLENLSPTSPPVPTPLPTQSPPTLSTTLPPITSTTPAPNSQIGSKRVIGYYTNWAQYRAGGYHFVPEDIDATKLTHVNYAFSILDGSFNVIPFEWNDFQMYQRFHNHVRAQNPTLKTFISLGGWNFNYRNATKDIFTTMVETSSNRNHFITSAITYARTHGFDGVDIDWEYPGHVGQGGRPQDKENFVAMLREFRHAIQEEAVASQKSELLLTIAVGAGSSTVQNGYDVENIHKYVDWVGVMTYDLHGAWERTTGFHTSMDSNEDLSVQGGMALWETYTPKDKLVMGVATYGRGWTVENSNDAGIGASAIGPSNEGSITGEAGFIAWYEINQIIAEGGVEQYDPVSKCMYVTKGNQWIGYDNIGTIRSKAMHVVNKGYSGVMVWALDLDDYKNGYPLISAIKQYFDANRVTTPSNPPTISFPTMPPEPTVPPTHIPTFHPTPTPPPTPPTSPECFEDVSKFSCTPSMVYTDTPGMTEWCAVTCLTHQQWHPSCSQIPVAPEDPSKVCECQCGDDILTPTPSPTPSPIPSPTPLPSSSNNRCQSWCRTGANTWEYKCSLNACHGCSECEVPVAPQNCFDNKDDFECVPTTIYQNNVGMQDWCNANCLHFGQWHPSCSRQPVGPTDASSVCECHCMSDNLISLSPPPPPPSLECYESTNDFNCMPTLAYQNNAGMQEWCDTTCLHAGQWHPGCSKGGESSDSSTVCQCECNNVGLANNPTPPPSPPPSLPPVDCFESSDEFSCIPTEIYMNTPGQHDWCSNNCLHYGQWHPACSKVPVSSNDNTMVCVCSCD